jgi:hypothetical protein
MIRGFLALPWFVWAVLALLIAVIYTFIWPQKAVTETAGFRFLLLRWGHAVTWLLLTINFVVRGISPSLHDAANLVALAGGLIYLLFLLSTFVVK